MIRHLGPFIERNVIVVVACENYFRTQTALEQLTQPLSDFEYEIFFQQTTPSHSSQIPSTMTSIHHDAQLRDARAELQVFARRRRNDDSQLVPLARPRKKI